MVSAQAMATATAMATIMATATVMAIAMATAMATVMAIAMAMATATATGNRGEDSEEISKWKIFQALPKQISCEHLKNAAILWVLDAKVF